MIKEKEFIGGSVFSYNEPHPLLADHFLRNCFEVGAIQVKVHERAFLKDKYTILLVPLRI
jgi:hypothetical protein